MDLVSCLGKSDIRRSLRTSDARAARRRAWTLLRAVEEAFETLRRAGLSSDARSAFGAILDHVIDEFDGGQSRWAERAKYRYLIERLVADEPLMPAFDREAAEAPRSTYPNIRPHPEAGPRVTADVAMRTAASRGGAMATVPSAAQPTAGASMSAADIAAMIDKGIGAAIKRAMARPGSDDLLSSRVPAFLQRKTEELGPKAKHLADYSGRIAVFIAIVGDKPIGAYTIEDMHRFRDILDQIPVKGRQRFKTADPLLQIRMNRELAIPFPPIDPVTVDAKYLSPIKTLFSHLEGLGVIEKSPLDGITSKRMKGEDGIAIGPSEERLPFEPDHLAKLRKIADQKPQSSPDRWWIRVLPRTGLRLDEFAVLSVFDIRQIHGRWCVDLLHLDNGDPAHRERRKELDVKTSNSRRVVPIHRALIEDGFLDLVEARRKRSGERAPLFPQCKPDRYGCYSSALSKRLTRQIDEVTPDRRHVTHSTRHNFAAACDAAGVPDSVRERFLGHAVDETAVQDGRARPRGSRAKLRRRYGSPIPSREEMDWIDRLQV
ncbi:Site-specific recombinase XerD [Consotaella salsifontis]|uniref:Site-specific recombinase XerD n=1 Tax=Consotaella salsifontis TaxID=1365950 RepID=A0A1T4S1N0_9HYPH|nr:Site-specific recombinase XerD [Consotaella salsifontis]